MQTNAPEILSNRLGRGTIPQTFNGSGTGFNLITTTGNEYIELTDIIIANASGSTSTVTFTLTDGSISRTVLVVTVANGSTFEHKFEGSIRATKTEVGYELYVSATAAVNVTATAYLQTTITENLKAPHPADNQQYKLFSVWQCQYKNNLYCWLS